MRHFQPQIYLLFKDQLFSVNKGLFLKVHEWLAITLIIGIMSTLSLVTYCHRQNLSQDLSFPLSTTSKEGIQVVVKGAVKYPGVYYFKESVLMQDILNLAEPLDSADLRRYQSHVRVKKNRLITIPEKAMITIHIKGAVKEITTLKLQKGTKLQDLLTLVDFEEAANLKFLEKKRPLIDQETLDIPYKKRP